MRLFGILADEIAVGSILFDAKTNTTTDPSLFRTHFANGAAGRLSGRVYAAPIPGKTAEENQTIPDLPQELDTNEYPRYAGDDRRNFHQGFTPFLRFPGILHFAQTFSEHHVFLLDLPFRLLFSKCFKLPVTSIHVRSKKDWPICPSNFRIAPRLDLDKS